MGGAIGGNGTPPNIGGPGSWGGPGMIGAAPILDVGLVVADCM